MGLPKFWRDSGRWNDVVVSLCVTLGLATWAALGWWLHWRWLMLAVVPAGLITGFVLGLLTISFLCAYCRREDR